jgi:hypothetical protein
MGQPAIAVKTHAFDGGLSSIAELGEYALPILGPGEPVSGFTMLTALRRLLASEVLENPGVVDDDPNKAFLGAYARPFKMNTLGRFGSVKGATGAEQCVGARLQARAGHRVPWTWLACTSVCATALGCSREPADTAPLSDGTMVVAPPARQMDASVPPVVMDSGTAAVTTADAGKPWTPVAPVCNGELPVMTTLDLRTGVEGVPDWSCYGAGVDAFDDGDAGVSEAATRMTAFRFYGWDKSVIQGTTVDVYWGRKTLGKPNATRTFEDDAGEILFPLPVGERHVSVHTQAVFRADSRYDISELRDYDVPIPGDGGTAMGYINLRDRRAIAALIFGAGGEVYDPAKALIMVPVHDCKDDDVGGVTVELVDTDTGAVVQDVVEQGQPRSAYLFNALPDRSCTFTSAGTNQAAWVMINAPVNVSGDSVTHGYKVRLKGRMNAAQAQPLVFAERVVELSAATTTVVRGYDRPR